MIWIAARGAGGPEVLVPEQVDTPVPGEGEVLIRVQAAGVNRPDVLQRQGTYPPPRGASPIIGLEVAGEVVAQGGGVFWPVLGEPVCALVNGGGYAEYALAPFGQCLPFPHGYDALRAGAVPETYFTVWANLFMLGRLRAGERVLIHGGSSGIGLTAIQLARAWGAIPYATAGSPEKVAACERFGAEAAIDYRQEDFAEAISRLTQGAGVDVVLDMVGAPYTARNIGCLARDGRLVQIAFLHGSKVEQFDLTPIMVHRLTITGSTMRPRSAAEKAAIAAELRRNVWPLLEQGNSGPVIYKVFPLAEAAQAHALMESGVHIGKIMLKVAD
jgi:NADPH2:quinone reductase